MATIIVACDPNNLIGTADNKIPWSLPDDMKFFRETTSGHPIIMGRNTWDSLPRKPLPKRTNIVVSRTMHSSTDNDTMAVTKPIIVESLQAALDSLKIFKNMEEPFIIGGAQIYRASLDQNLVDKIIMTRVRTAYRGTVYFPDVQTYGFGVNRKLIEHPDFEILEYTK
jgi:dihydrofolate reductase